MQKAKYLIEHFGTAFDGEIVRSDHTGRSNILDFILENIEKTSTPKHIIAGERANFLFITTTDFD